MRAATATVIAGTLALAACGGGSNAETGLELPPAVQPSGPTTIGDETPTDGAPDTADEPGESSTTLPPPTTASGGVQLDASTCSTIGVTVEVAIEAHWAQWQELPGTMQELVDDGLLREAPTEFVLQVDADGEPQVRPAAGGPCDYDVEAALAAASEANALATESAQCALDTVLLETAIRRLVATGRSVDEWSIETVAERLPDAALLVTTATLQPDGTVVPVSDPCDQRDVLVISQPGWIGMSDECLDDLLVLGAGVGVAGVDPMATDAESIDLAGLIAGGFVDSRDYLYEVEDGLLWDVEGSGCPLIEPLRAEETANACDVERRVLETAVEVFVVEFGRPPASIDELVISEYVSEPPTGWTLDVTDDATEPVATPGGPCAD